MREILNTYLNELSKEKKDRVNGIVKWIEENFSHLKLEIKWNQPMFIDHGTYIIGLSVSKMHLAIGLEARSMDRLIEIIKKSEYEHSKMLIKIKWTQEIDYEFLDLIITDIIKDKKSIKTFWY